MSAHSLYTLVKETENGFTFVEGESLEGFQDELDATLGVFEKHSDMSHEEFLHVSDDVDKKGTWFVAHTSKEGVMNGYEYPTANDLRQTLPSLLETAHGHDDVVIFPPTAAVVPEEEWRKYA